MRGLKDLLKALVALGVLLAGVGLLLPRYRHVERSAELAASRERIWPLVEQTRRWSEWSPWYAKDPAMKLSYAGPASGAGAEWSWDSDSQGRGRMRFEQVDAPRRLAYRLDFETMGSTATGDLTLEPRGTGTHVTWRFDTDLGLNPLSRWFGLGLDRMVGRDFERGLAKLGELAQQVPAGKR